MSQYVTLMQYDLLATQQEIGEIVELSRMVLDTQIDSRLYPVDCTISWDEECFEADLKWLQENGVTGYIIVDLEGGEFVRYKLTDEGVKKAAGRVYFSGDQEITLGPLMVQEEDIQSLERMMPLGLQERAYLREHEQELGDFVGQRIMEEYYMDVLQDEAEDMLANMETEA